MVVGRSRTHSPFAFSAARNFLPRITDAITANSVQELVTPNTGATTGLTTKHESAPFAAKSSALIVSAKQKDDSNQKEEVPQDDDTSEELPSDSSSEKSVQTSQELQIQKEHVEEVKRIVNKNPRITLWSSRSSAVFRYLRKTEPEFSISKEASLLIEEAVSKKYPEIWALFDED